jgi:hypothetical protein
MMVSNDGRVMNYEHGTRIAGALLFLPLKISAASNSAEEIPALQPPRGEIPPGFWEQYGIWVTLGVVVVLGLVGFTIWWFSRPKVIVPLPPAEQARRTLQPLVSQAEDGVVLSQVSQTLRRYVIAAFSMPPGEVTTTEFCRAMEDNLEVGPQLTSQLGEFLRSCDQRKFAPSVPPQSSGAVARAFEFIEKVEARLMEIRQAAGPRTPMTRMSREESAG